MLIRIAALRESVSEVQISRSMLVLLLGVFVCMGCGATSADLQTNSSKEPSVTQPQPIFTRDSQVMPAAFAEGATEASAFPERSEQELAASALGRIGKPAVPQLVLAMRNRDARVRAQAALVLAKMGPDARDAVPQLTAALDDENVAVRKAASRALGEIGPAAEVAVPALMRTLVQPNASMPNR